MITFQMFEDGRGYVGAAVVMNHSNGHLLNGTEDISDLFWCIMGKIERLDHPSPHIQDMLQCRERVKWLLRNGLPFCVEPTVYDNINFYNDSEWSEFHECINFRFTISDPDTAMLFKLTWGGT